MNKPYINKENIKAIILAGGCDVRSYLAGQSLPTSLWPIAGKSVIASLLGNLSKYGIKQGVICCNGDGAALFKSINFDNCIDIKFIDESLPLGPGGCIRAASDKDNDGLLLVFSANMACPVDIDVIIDAHHCGGADLTVMFNPTGKNSKSPGETAGIYVCELNVLDQIPKDGYFDIKEGLIPAMLRSGKAVNAASLTAPAGNFRSWQEYLLAIEAYFENYAETDLELPILKRDKAAIVWADHKAEIHPSVRFFGRVAVMRGSCISKDAIIFGPTIIGRDVNIGENSVVVNSVFWDNAKIESNCEIQRCVLCNNAVLQSCNVVDDKFIALRSGKIPARPIGRGLAAVKENTDKFKSTLLSYINKMTCFLPDSLKPQERNISAYLAGGLLFVIFLWSYWPGIVDMWAIWQRSDEYSAGLLVPFLAVYILWSRRHSIVQAPVRPSLWGLAAFTGAQGVRFFGLAFMYGSLERLSIVFSIVALVLLVFGWQFLWKVSTILLFLFLMLPWPNRVQAMLALPLQNWSTSSAVFCLETIGYDIVREGNVIHIGQTSVAVAEACNGLRMITAFFVISGMVVLLVNRKWWEKLIVLLSCLPVALLCNTVRLVITSICFTMLKGEHWERIFHDFGGYAMMPLALVFMVFELFLLRKLTTLPTEDEAVVITRKT
ncbi:MAG TPA: exosortase [Sedimentisphaerales bacterium]|nr:exosortase [Sedimentisphaerales bacterium]